MQKLTIVINGKAGSGKDTLINMLADKYKVLNVSSITPIKEIASMAGWDGEKTEKARKFLSDLKRLIVEFNDYPTNYLLDKQAKFIKSKNQIMFVHIRESEEIKKFLSLSKTKTFSLLIIKDDIIKKSIGNTSDDNICDYNYDFVYHNNLDLTEAKADFINYFENNILNKI